ncbi:MAG: putative MnhB-related membrane protein [Kiritimatiellia bacterium]|jgi:uncharacterized MnhB-related membrane protein
MEPPVAASARQNIGSNVMVHVMGLMSAPDIALTESEVMVLGGRSSNFVLVKAINGVSPVADTV